jgi:transposase InsO family protein
MPVKYLMRDRDGKYPALFNAVLADAGLTVVLSGIRMPRMNAVMERWVRTCRRELLDRTLIWNQRHLLHALREYELFYNTHHPYQGIANARPLARLHEPITDPDRFAHLTIHLAGAIAEPQFTTWSGWYVRRSRSYSACVTGSTVPCRGRAGRL